MGLTREDAQKILREVQANHARLKGCSGPHEFRPRDGDRHHLVCTRCGGEVMFHEAHWYQLGLEHGSRDAKG